MRQERRPKHIYVRLTGGRQSIVHCVLLQSNCGDSLKDSVAVFLLRKEQVVLLILCAPWHNLWPSKLLASHRKLLTTMWHCGLLIVPFEISFQHCKYGINGMLGKFKNGSNNA